MSNPPDAPDTGELTEQDVTMLFGIAHHFQAETGDRAYSDRIADLAIRIRAKLAAVSLPSDSGELERALGEFVHAVRHEGEFDKSQFIAARKSVLDLFERLQNRIAEQAEQLEDYAYSEKCLLEGNANLAADALTPEEAAFLEQLQDDAYELHEYAALGEQTFAKLKALSSLRSSSLGEPAT